MSSTQRRISHEIKEMKNNPPENVLSTKIISLYHWRCVIAGPSDSPYRNGRFKINIQLQKYPTNPPVIRFITPIYHCNIRHGHLFLDIFNPDKWSAAWTISNILIGIIDLLREPNPFNPLSPAIAHLYLTNIEVHNSKARFFTYKSATQQHHRYKWRNGNNR